MTRSRGGDVTAEFQAALVEIDGVPEPGLLPVRLAKAAAAVLPVDAVGVSLFDGDFRVPLGASDDQATLAERLQFTEGEGPCLAAGLDHRTSVSGHERLAHEWPHYAEELFERTPYRAILSLPLAITRTTRGAIDLYLVEEHRLEEVSLAEAATIADAMSAALRSVNGPTGVPYPPDDDQITWLQGTAAHARSLVWIAMGILMTKFDLTAADALALLRGYAFGHDLLLDDTAAELVGGRLRLAELRP